MSETVLYDITGDIMNRYKMFDNYHNQLTDIIKVTVDDFEPKGDFLALKYPEITHIINEEHANKNRKKTVSLAAEVSNKYDCQVRIGNIQHHPHDPRFAYAFMNKKPPHFLGYTVLVPKEDHRPKELKEPEY